jgi:two-component system chemotaxis response regulator CheB
LPAAIFVTVHVAADFSNDIAGMLARAGPFAVRKARHGEPILARTIYVAPPDQHLLVRPGRVELSREAREDHARPAIDALFRSAAASYGPRVVAVLLSGMLGDGATGLMAVKTRGGLALVHDPAETPYPSMPQRAIDTVKVDLVASSADLSGVLAGLVNEERDLPGQQDVPAPAEHADTIVRDLRDQANGSNVEKLTPFSCPACGGALWQLNEAGEPQFRCHVGHAFSHDMLLIEQSEALETALWSAVRRLMERAVALRQSSTRARQSGDLKRVRELEAQARRDEEHMELIRDKLLRVMPRSYEMRALSGESREQG